MVRLPAFCFDNVNLQILHMQRHIIFSIHCDVAVCPIATYKYTLQHNRTICVERRLIYLLLNDKTRSSCVFHLHTFFSHNGDEDAFVIVANIIIIVVVQFCDSKSNQLFTKKIIYNDIVIIHGDAPLSPKPS